MIEDEKFNPLTLRFHYRIVPCWTSGTGHRSIVLLTLSPGICNVLLPEGDMVFKNPARNIKAINPLTTKTTNFVHAWVKKLDVAPIDRIDRLFTICICKIETALWTSNGFVFIYTEANVFNSSLGTPLSFLSLIYRWALMNSLLWFIICDSRFFKIPAIFLIWKCYVIQYNTIQCNKIQTYIHTYIRT